MSLYKLHDALALIQAHMFGVDGAHEEAMLDMRIRLLEMAYDDADLRAFARVALTVEPQPSSYEIKHGAIPAGEFLL